MRPRRPLVGSLGPVRLARIYTQHNSSHAHECQALEIVTHETRTIEDTGRVVSDSLGSLSSTEHRESHTGRQSSARHMQQQIYVVANPRPPGPTGESLGNA